MNFQEPDPQWKQLEAKLTNASTAQEVIAIRTEAFYKKFYDIVRQGRMILISSFGYKIAENGTLTPPQQA